jgi:dGTP triphosphohydrolase
MKSLLHGELDSIPRWLDTETNLAEAGMCLYCNFWLSWEGTNLAPYAVHSADPWYTKRAEPARADDPLDPCGNRSRYRTPFEIDKDRITNSQAFRRLEYKTQVFVTHEGDNFRTRLTHTLEVAEIAKHIARALRLNEHLVEAIALGHDLGHAPYGHAAEDAINAWLNGSDLATVREHYQFCHNRQSVEIVEELEPGYDWDARPSAGRRGRGLNLTRGVREGILAHTSRGFRGQVHRGATFDPRFENAIREQSDADGGKGLFFPGSLEAQVVRIADDLAQISHDLEDGLRSGLLSRDHIAESFSGFLNDLPPDMLEGLLKKKGRYLEYGNSRVSKTFLHDVVSMLRDPREDLRDTFGKRDYSTLPVREINRALRGNKRSGGSPTYREDFLLTAQIAYLLHMWRSGEYFVRLTVEDQTAARSRLLKYVRLARMLLGRDPDQIKNPPTLYHVVAFLRGMMMANVIEHSYWKIHNLLDPDFRSFQGEPFVPADGSGSPRTGDSFVVFVLVDGVARSSGGRITFKEASPDGRFFCFRFAKGEEDRAREFARKFTERELGNVLRENGANLEGLSPGAHGEEFPLRRLRWLIKSEDPRRTEGVLLETPDGEGFVAAIENVSIYFTGYRELCPGVDGDTCANASEDVCRSSSQCPFQRGPEHGIRFPDCNRLVEFQECVGRLEAALTKLVAERIHRGSRVYRMGKMGKKVITFLLDTYLHDPRVMHERVWSRLRSYPKMAAISPAVRQWVKKGVAARNKEVIPEAVLECLTRGPGKDANPSDRYSLVRRVIDHVSGMTDRYVVNEYHRLTHPGREVEFQDEVYFTE